MEPNITMILNRIRDLYEKGKLLEEEYKACLKENKPGKMQQLRIREKTLCDQLEHIKKKLDSKINGKIVNVTFLFNNHELHGRFVNLSDEDVYKYYDLLGKAHEANVKVIKISRESTFISDVPLNS